MDACIGEMMAVVRADAYFRVVQKGNFFFKIFDGFLKRQFGWMSQGVATHTRNRLRIRQGMQSRAARAVSSVVRESSFEVRVWVCARTQSGNFFPLGMWGRVALAVSRSTIDPPVLSPTKRQPLGIHPQ